MNKQVTEYLTSRTLKDALGIQGDTITNMLNNVLGSMHSDTDEEIQEKILDKKISLVTLEANVEVGMRLKPHITKSPIDVESDTYVQAKIVALSLAKALWYESSDNYNRASKNRSKYETQMKYLIEAIKTK